MRFALPILTIALAACTTQKAAPAPAADSTATAAPMDTMQHAMPMMDSASRAVADTAKKPMPVGPKKDAPIGHDSAFGAKFELGADGKVTPVPPKKP
ncbi:MAG: hypothetical protein K2X99_09470 [Gemmatimonadaceae bacterium]|nr:hypothetical protein [Gemmatimonadaceae bacterium]